MKRFYMLIAAVLLIAGVFAQAPQKLSYQAVIRNSSNLLVTNHALGMRISILQGSISGVAVYTETQAPTTNDNGLVTIEIGAGTTTDNFSAINWANGPYFIKTETDPTTGGGTNYTISGTNQLLSVPYALHSKTAESLTGGITETDPIFGASSAKGITATNVSNWNAAFGWGNHAGLYRLISYVPAWSEITSNPFNFTAPSNNQLLKYNSVSGKWENWTSTYLTAEVDGSVTNEIELPTQTGNSGKILTTNGTSPSWVAPSGGSSTRAVTSTSNYTIQAGDNVLISTAATVITYTLPDAAVAGSGAVLNFYGITSAFNITTSQAIYDINGVSNTTLSSKFIVTLASDGINKWVQLK